MCSIFATKSEAKAWGEANDRHTPRRPLAEKTLARIARGIRKYVVENPEPFIVDGAQAPVFVPRYGEREGQKPRALRVDQPSPVIVPTGNGASLVSAYLARHWGGMTGMGVDQPMPTITTKGSQDQPVTVELAQEADGRSERVIAFLSKYYGQGTGQGVDEPAHTLTSKERLALVTVTVNGEPWVIVDIAMRMLTPRELYRCQGFKSDFIIDQGVELDGDEQLGLSLWNTPTSVPLTKTAQVRMVGNSVPPHLAEALALSNAPAAILRARRTA
jgi:DNA (cytosine-5)-methyltransferase 1